MQLDPSYSLQASWPVVAPFPNSAKELSAETMLVR